MSLAPEAQSVAGFWVGLPSSKASEMTYGQIIDWQMGEETKTTNVLPSLLPALSCNIQHPKQAYYCLCPACPSCCLYRSVASGALSVLAFFDRKGKYFFPPDDDLDGFVMGIFGGTDTVRTAESGPQSRWSTSGIDGKAVY